MSEGRRVDPAGRRDADRIGDLALEHDGQQCHAERAADLLEDP
jgi:hypothetical protein